MRRDFFAKFAVLVAALSLVAAACGRDGGGENGKTKEDGKTQEARSLLDVVKERGTIRCGVNDSVPGFGFIPEGGTESEGFDIDFCKAFAAGVLGDAEAHELVPISADERFNALRAGEYDVLVRNTTWTSSRDGAEGVAFTAVNFYDGQGMMVRAGEFGAVKDMDGTAVCVTAGTTTELNLADYAAEQGVDIEAVVFETNDEILPAFKEKRCDGWTSDKSQLAGLKSQFEGELGELEILPDTMSKEPLTPAVLDGDSKWQDAIAWIVRGMIAAEELGVDSGNVQDEAAKPSNPSIGNLLGAAIEDDETGTSAPFDPGLGLAPDFMVTVISQVGNYGEVYDRHVGPDTPLGLDRGLNALWTDGGLLYAPPIR